MRESYENKKKYFFLLRLNPKIKGINLYSKNKQFLSSETDWLDTFDFNVIDFEDIIF